MDVPLALSQERLQQLYSQGGRSARLESVNVEVKGAMVLRELVPRHSYFGEAESAECEALTSRRA